MYSLESLSSIKAQKGWRWNRRKYKLLVHLQKVISFSWEFLQQSIDVGVSERVKPLWDFAIRMYFDDLVNPNTKIWVHPIKKQRHVLVEFHHIWRMKLANWEYFLILSRENRINKKFWGLFLNFVRKGQNYFEKVYWNQILNFLS